MSELHYLIAKFSDLAVELEKHSNDHIHDELPDNVAAAVEGVCADRINAILKLYREVAKVPESATPAPELSDKNGWVYDPDGELRKIRAGMASPAESAKGEKE